MPIDLERFVTEKIALVPIVNKRGIFNGRRFVVNTRDGWYNVRFGEVVHIERPATDLEPLILMVGSNLPIIKGYWIGNAIIPLNFSDARFRGFGETIDVHFGQANIGEPVECRIWEDGTVLFQSGDTGQIDFTIYTVKERFEKEEPLGKLKGVTPEMRYFYLLLSLQRDHIRTWKELDKMKLSGAERTKRVEEYKNTLSGRLQGVVEATGAKLVRFNKRGDDRLEVVWKLGEQVFSSIMNLNFRMLELGYCAEGHDKDHTISSAINLAKMFQEEDLIYVTRE